MKNKFDVSLKFFLFSLLFFVLSKANINGIIYPFAFSMLFSLAWANQKVWILAPAYLIGSIANSPTFEGIISSLVTITALVIPYYIHVASKTPMKKWEVFIYCLLSQSAYIMFTALGGGNLIFMFGSLIVGEVFLFLSMFIFEPLVTRGLAYKLTTIELLCGSIVVMAISDGLLMCDIYGFSVFKLFVSLLILVVSYVSNVTFTLMIASIISVGTLFPSNNPIFVAPLILWGLAVSVYRGQNKIYSSLGLICAEMLSTFYFNLYYFSHFLSYLPVIISAFIFVVLPKIYLKPISNIFASSSSRTAIKNVVNRNRDLLQRRLYNLSEVFFDMNNVFKKMIKKEMSKDEVEDMIYSEVKNSICKNCPEHSHCHRTFGDDTKKMFKELIMIALERGKITLLDFPSYLSSRCGKLNLLINEINTLSAEEKQVFCLEITKTEKQIYKLKNEIMHLLFDQNGQNESVIVELYCSNITTNYYSLLDAYKNFCENNNYNFNKISENKIEICGKNASKYFLTENGVHKLNGTKVEVLCYPAPQREIATFDENDIKIDVE